MGRSLTPATAQSRPASHEKRVIAEFDAGGCHYVVEDSGGHIVHRESKQEANGRDIVAREVAIAYVLGSGTRGRSYLFENGEYLFQSPISWFATGRRWDLSPGYELNNAHFERTIQPDCLFCHTNRFEPVADCAGRYQPPTLRQGHSIGCERCHGPGGLHARERDIQDGRDLTIVNPAHLDPPLREAVCEQCHLKGEARIERAGRRELEYRPGLPLDQFVSVFFSPDALSGKARTVGHVEQMHASQCFRESGGRLGCVSCHDPHGVPPASEKASFYRARCLECHADRGCTLPHAERVRRDGVDDCIACHMPRVPSEDIAHTAITIHEIPRDSAGILARVDAEPPLSSTEGILVPLGGAGVPGERDRDLGIALSQVGQANRGTPGAVRMLRNALPLLDAALAARPDDLAAVQAKAVALSLTGRPADALETVEAGLEIAPSRQSLLQLGAGLAAVLGRHEHALRFRQRAVAAGGASSDDYAEFAKLLAQDRQWDQAAEALRNALALNPNLESARKLLVKCYLKSRKVDQARVEFTILLKFDPLQRDSLLRWFEEQSEGPGQAEP